MKIKTNWQNYHSYLRQATIGRIPQYFHWKAYMYLLKRIVFNKNIDILELGSGTGLNTLKMCNYFDTNCVTLIDNNTDALRMSEKLFRTIDIKKEFIEEDVTNFNTDRRFDLVHSHGLVEHFQASVTKDLIKKHIGLARSNGYIIIFVPTPIGNYMKCRKVCERLNLWPFPDERPISEKELMDEANKYNIEIIDSIVYYVVYPTLGILIKKI